MRVLGIFLSQKDIRHPVSGMPLSKLKRMNSMYEIVTNVVYKEKYNKAERLLAADLIKQIIEEY